MRRRTFWYAGIILLGAGLTLTLQDGLAESPLPTAVQQTERHDVRPLDEGGEDCASATVISNLPYFDTGNTDGYLDDYYEACEGGAPGSRDVVYAFTPQADVSVSISVCDNAAYDTKLYVYQGSCPGTLVGCNDDYCYLPGYPEPRASYLECLPLLNGTTYYIIVDGEGDESGVYLLDIWQCIPCDTPPPNDSCQNATVVELPYTGQGDLFCSHSECYYPGTYSDVWYTFTIPSTGNLTIDFCGSTPALWDAYVVLSTECVECSLQTFVFADGWSNTECVDGNWFITWHGLPQGTYWYPVLGSLEDPSLYGPFTINMSLPTGATVIPPPHAVPEMFRLSSYPNPFNSETRLRMAVPQPGEFTLELYDLLGRKMAVLWEGVVTTDQEIAFSAANLPSGVYIVHAVESSSRRPVATAKLALVK